MNKTRIYTREMRIENAVFIKDAVQVRKDIVWRWVFHYLDDYWFGYLGNVEPSDLRPILLDFELLTYLEDVIIPVSRGHYKIRGTNFTMQRSRYGFDIMLGSERIANVRFLHQLQNVYYDFTGSDLINARNRSQLLELFAEPIPVEYIKGTDRFGCPVISEPPYVRFGGDDEFNVGEDGSGFTDQYPTDN